MIKGMSIETAARYVFVIDRIEKLVDKIHCLAYMMSLCCEIDEGVHIIPYCVGYVGKTIATDVLRITDYLDNEFASILEVKSALEEAENPDPCPELYVDR